MNAPGGRFLTYESYRRSSSHTHERPSRNRRPASGAETPSRPEGHARTTRVGGATRRALHGAEHRLTLNDVMATSVRVGRRADRVLSDHEVRLPAVMPTRRRETPTQSAPTSPRRPLGRERPSRQRAGAKSGGTKRGSLTPQPPALTRRRVLCGQQRTPPDNHL
jgi:hypothetical protein